LIDVWPQVVPTQAVYTAVLSRADFIKIAKGDVDAPGALSPSVATSAGLALEILRILRDVFPQTTDVDLFDCWTRVFTWFTGKIVEVTDTVRTMLHNVDVRYTVLRLLCAFLMYFL
jgi:hypothetical protein